MRTTQLDPDNRPRPKTNTYCVKCNRDLKSGQSRREIHLISGGAEVLHPADEALYVPDAGDMGWHFIGSDCARKIGPEFSVPCVSGRRGAA